MSAALIRATMRPRCTFGFHSGQCRRGPIGMANRTFSYSAVACAYVGKFGTSVISRR